MCVCPSKTQCTSPFRQCLESDQGFRLDGGAVTADAVGTCASVVTSTARYIGHPAYSPAQSPCASAGLGVWLWRLASVLVVWKALAQCRNASCGNHSGHALPISAQRDVYKRVCGPPGFHGSDIRKSQTFQHHQLTPFKSLCHWTFPLSTHINISLDSSISLGILSHLHSRQRIDR